jgi:Leucine-rich repeat (LRR) protein
MRTTQNQTKTLNMKKLLVLLLFVTGCAFAQPVINNPEPYQVCDDNGDGFAAFDLNLITPTLITVQGTEISYYETLTDSQNSVNPINLLVPFTNTTPFNQTLYIRAIDIANPSIPSFTTLNVVVSQKPTVSMSSTSNCVGNSITVTTTVNGSGTYNYLYTLPLGVSDPGNVPSFSTTFEGSYFVTVTDVATGCVSNQVGIYVFFTPLPGATVDATSICDGNPASVFANITSVNTPSYSWTVPVGATNPGNVSNFTTSLAGTYSVIVTDTTNGCVSNQVSTTVSTQTSVTPTFTIPPSACAGFILPTTSDNGISGTWSPTFLATDTYLFTPSLGQCATLYSTFIIVNDAPNANQPPNLVQNTTNNNAVFDLTSQNSIINNGSGVQFEYFLSLLDAQNNTNAIPNPTAYTNVSNPQTIYVRIVDLTSGSCAATTSFNLVINNPNNVYIPDANFKARLISFGVDTNFDGEIQFTEAAAFNTELNVNASLIADLTGIEAFINITILRCAQNSLTDLNINNLTNLETLDCSNNQIATLNISNLINLKNLICISNLLTSLDVSALTLLEELNFYNNQVTTINVDALLNLKILNCSYNRILLLSVNNLPILERLECAVNYSTSFTISNLPNLEYLDCAYNFSLISLSLTQFPLLEYIDCRSNGLTNLNISNLNNLMTLYADNNSLTTINLSNLPNLSTLYVNYNQLTSLNLEGLTNLSTLFCQNNQLNIINFEGLNALVNVVCDNNLLTSLDFSLTPNLSYVSCSYNNLSNINIKNGTNSFNSNTNWSQNPLLNFVCCDDGELAAVNQILSQSQNSNNGNVVFNSYCSFVPGGNFNTITGQIKLDANNNGCEANDNSQPLIRVNINDGLTQGATVTDANGNYTFYTTTGFFTIAPEVDNPSSFSFSPPTASVAFGNTNSNVSTQNFCINQNGSFQDVEIVIVPIDFARPGSTATYKLFTKTKGIQYHLVV